MAHAPPDDREPLLLDRPVPEPGRIGLGAFRNANGAAELALAVVAVGAVVSLAVFVDTFNTALTLTICAAGAAGLAAAVWRRWALAAVATLGALYLAFAIALLHEALSLALALLSLAAAGGAAIGLRRPDGVDAWLDWRVMHKSAPSAVVAASAMLAALVWLAASQIPTGAMAGPAWVSIMLVALAAAAVRAHFAAPQALAAAILGLLLGFTGYMRARFGAPLADAFYGSALVAALCVALAAALARPHRAARALIAAFGAGGATLLFAVAAFSQPDWHGIWAWGSLACAAALLFGGAWFTARESAAAHADRAVDLWCLGAGALALLAVESALPPLFRPVADAAIALGCTRASLHWNWRGLRLCALAAGAISVLSLLSLGDEPGAGSFFAMALSAALLWIAARMGGHDVASHDRLAAIATVATVLAVLFGLSWRISALELDGLAGSGLYATALIGMGALLHAPHAGEPLARWRGPALAAAGLGCALIGGGLIANPWWGAEPVSVDGPLIFNAMFVGFGLPIIAGALASRRILVPAPSRDVIFLGVAALALLWAALEIRHGFHGAVLSTGSTGAVEGVCYALLMLGVTLASQTVRARWREAGGVLAWIGLAVAAYLLLWGASPLRGATAPSALAAFLQAGAAAMAFVLARRAQSARHSSALSTAAFAVALAIAWSAGHVLLAWAQMTLFLPVWPLALTWLVWRHRDRIGLRALGFVAPLLVWPALGVAAFGLWTSLNPWWGGAPASLTGPLALGLSSYAAAAWLSLNSRDVYGDAAAPWLRRAAIATCILHAWIGATLVVRRCFHENLTVEMLYAVEAFAIAFAWALVGLAASWFGLQRGGSAVARWLGLAALGSAAVWAAYTIATRASGSTQAWLAAGLVAAIAVTLWFAATYRPRRGKFFAAMRRR
jgi:hypothetical protein